MKKTFTFLFIALFISGFSSLHSQLSFDFETWTKENDTLAFSTPEPLTFWGHVNKTAEGLVSLSIPDVIAQCSPDAEAHGGFQAAKMESKKYNLGAYSPKLIGFLHTGVIDLDPMTYAVIADLRVENTTKYSNMKGWYKYAPAEGDSCVFTAELYSADSTVVATAKMKSGAVSEYTELNIPFVYADESAAVTHIGIYISAGNTHPSMGPYGPEGISGSVLLLDDLELSTSVGIINSHAKSKTIQVYQADMDNLYVKGAENSKLEIYSITGQHIMTSFVRSSEETIAIGQLKKGIYLYRVTTNEMQTVSGKFVK